uniref:biotin carboxylase N-terminal domain-containing protein n=1 Tax=uncultured Maritalea sp. TaxID=757249 RepID=UPI00263167EA
MKINKILVANRSEIAIRVFRAANEMGIKTVAVFAEEDKLALHRFKADESYLIGQGLGPVEAYLQIDEYIRIAKLSGADAIHPGYGLLSESPEFVDACEDAGIIFIGPKAETMRALGNKVAARNIAEKAGVPVVPATKPLPDDMDEVVRLAEEVGYPLMLKASWGGGGRGIRRCDTPEELKTQYPRVISEATKAFGSAEVFMEKCIVNPRHIEVQILADSQGNVVHLFERDCSIQRRNQKLIE